MFRDEVELRNIEKMESTWSFWGGWELSRPIARLEIPALCNYLPLPARLNS